MIFTPFPPSSHPGDPTGIQSGKISPSLARRISNVLQGDEGECREMMAVIEGCWRAVGMKTLEVEERTRKLDEESENRRKEVERGWTMQGGWSAGSTVDAERKMFERGEKTERDNFHLRITNEWRILLQTMQIIMQNAGVPGFEGPPTIDEQELDRQSQVAMLMVRDLNVMKQAGIEPLRDLAKQMDGTIKVKSIEEAGERALGIM